jgi:hypothetical protein
MERLERGSSETSHVDAQADTWFSSYAEPLADPKKRYRRARHQQRRSERSRQAKIRRRETMMMIASFMLVGLMTAWFYVVLTR